MKVLSFGEILWDINGDKRTLGGAPLNVAGHVHRLGGDSLIVSAVGDDELGYLTLSAIDELGVDRSLVRLSSDPTGVAMVRLDDGIPSYSFNDPAAWDDIRLDDAALSNISSVRLDAVVYGTLAARHGATRSALISLLDAADSAEFFFDVNIRLSFYSDSVIRAGLERSTILKMNDDEVPVVAAAIGCSERDIIRALFSFPRLGRILITRGKDGSYCYTRDGRSIHAGTGDVKAIDTVGAGDSLSAAFLYFLSAGCGEEEALRKASLLADYVVTRPGAIPEYDESIRKMLGIC